MSKAVINKIISKLSLLDQYLKYLTEIQKVNQKKFINDFIFLGAAERYLQLSIEIIIDVGKLIIIAENIKRPEANKEIFPILHDEKIISEKLAEKLVGITGFRNILVHLYAEVDKNKVYENLQEGLDDFRLFKKEILSYLKKK